MQSICFPTRTAFHAAYTSLHTWRTLGQPSPWVWLPGFGMVRGWLCPPPPPCLSQGLTPFESLLHTFSNSDVRQAMPSLCQQRRASLRFWLWLLKKDIQRCNPQVHSAARPCPRRALVEESTTIIFITEAPNALRCGKGLWKSIWFSSLGQITGDFTSCLVTV